MQQGARDAVRADDGKQFLLDSVRGGKMARPQTGHGDDRFAHEGVIGHNRIQSGHEHPPAAALKR